MTTAEAVVLADAKRNANTLSTPLSDRWRNKIGNVFRVLNDTEDAQLVARILNASFSSPPIKAQNPQYRMTPMAARHVSDSPPQILA